VKTALIFTAGDVVAFMESQGMGRWQQLAG
jgi:hypothetical protein